MNAPQPDSRGWYAIEGAIARDAVLALREVGHLDKLSITKGPLVTVRSAKLLRHLQSVAWLWLWCDVTRAAMCHVIQMPGLETLDVLSVRPPGALSGFEHATSLRALRANHYLREADLLAVSRCNALRELGAQGAVLTVRAMEALLALPQLEALDLEGTPFDDEMAKLTAQSATIRSLDLGATRLTHRGLSHLVEMTQLRSLDLWATPLGDDDLELLRQLPALEYVSVGGYVGSPSLDASRLVSLLLALPSLKRVWLDGVAIEASQVAGLKERLEAVRVTH